MGAAAGRTLRAESEDLRGKCGLRQLKDVPSSRRPRPDVGDSRLIYCTAHYTQNLGTGLVGAGTRAREVHRRAHCGVLVPPPGFWGFRTMPSMNCHGRLAVCRPSNRFLASSARSTPLVAASATSSRVILRGSSGIRCAPPGIAAAGFGLLVLQLIGIDRSAASNWLATYTTHQLDGQLSDSVRGSSGQGGPAPGKVGLLCAPWPLTGGDLLAGRGRVQFNQATWVRHAMC